MAITNYNVYLKRLESIYHTYGYPVSDTILRSFIIKENLDVKFKITIHDLQKDLAALHNKVSMHQSITSSARSAQKPVVKSAPPSEAVIKTYPEYMTALEKLYINKGNVILNDTEIQNFISINKIDTAFGVTKADVKKDLQTIDRKWHPPGSIPKIQPCKTSSPPKSKAKLTTYKQYMNALELLYVQNGKSLSDHQISEFISNNAIDSGFGVTITDVKHDLQDIEKKLNVAKPIPLLSYEDYERALSVFVVQHGDKSFLDLYIKKFISTHGLDRNNPNLMSDIRMDLVFTQSKLPLNSATAKRFRTQTAKPMVPAQQPTPDNKFKSDVATIILKHKESFSKSPSIKGLLWDYFPDKKREINVLLILANYGMLEDMRLERTLGTVFINKYVTRIVNEYGIEKNFAMEMALVWCHGYGVGLLGKKLIL